MDVITSTVWCATRIRTETIGMYMSNVLKCMTHCNLLSHADDTQNYYSIKHFDVNIDNNLSA